ncbi:uncharacterized protein, partial [Triticum aestivum]|uniref:uncharacterized protein n=1 Tax=Triticum aestivum TaxID=4565 RepID=UPI001D024CA4
MGRRPRYCSPAAPPDVPSSSTMVATKKVPVLNTAYNAGMLHSIAGDWNPNMKVVFKGAGIDELCKIKLLGNNNRIFSMSLLSRIDPKNMKMDMGDGNFVEINGREVSKCLGLEPCGRKIDIPGGACLADRGALLARLHDILDTQMHKACKIPIVEIKNIVQTASKVAIVGAEKEKMMAACTIIAASTFLVPKGAHPKISYELLPVLADPSHISDYDFCDYVVEGLREAATKLREDLLHDPSQLILQGCLVIPQIIFCDYHEHGMQGREGLPLPRLAHYSDTFMRLQTKKHAARNGVDAGFEVSDVPRSPAFNVASGSAAPAQPLNTPSPGVHATAAGFGMAQDKEVDPQILAALREAVENQFRKREEAFVKMVDEAKDKVLEEIRTKAAAKRQRDLEETLDDFIERVKRQAPVAAAFPNVSQSPHVPRRMTDIVTDLAATSREAARSLMAVVVRNEDANKEHVPEAGQAARQGAAIPTIESARGKEPVTPLEYDEPMVPDDEPDDKPMIEDVKGKGPAIQLPPRRCTRQTTMHEALGCGARDQVVPDMMHRGDTTMGEAVAPDLPKQRISTVTPLGNKRLALPGGGQQSNPLPLAVVPAMPPQPPAAHNYGFSPFELELHHFFYPDHVCMDLYETVEMLSEPSELSRTWFEHFNPTVLRLDGHKIKYQFSLLGEMLYTGLDAWVRGWNERESRMMARVHLPNWRGLVPPDVV